MSHFQVFDETRGSIVAERVALADTEKTRMVGLLGKSGLDAGEGLWIRPSSGVHTVGMKFTIDVIGLDGKNRVIKLWPELPPWRLTSLSWRMRSVVELPAGTIRDRQVQVGDVLNISRVETQPQGNA